MCMACISVRTCLVALVVVYTYKVRFMLQRSAVYSLDLAILVYLLS